MKLSHFFRVLYITILSFVFCTFKTLAIENIDERVKKLTLELRCMTCQNQSIYDSDAEFSNDIKKIVKNNALNNLSLAEASADAKEIAKKAAQQSLDDISGQTAFNNALNAGSTLAAAGAAADNAIRAAAANAGITNDIISAGVNAQGAAYTQALSEGKSAQEAFTLQWMQVQQYQHLKLTKRLQKMILI